MSGGFHTRTFVRLLGYGLVASLVPFAGAFFLLGTGMALAAMGERQVRKALRQTSDDPVITIAEAAKEQQVQFRGRVASEARFTAPRSGHDAVLVAASVERRTTAQLGGEEVWSKRWSEPFELRDDSGDIAMVQADEAELLLRAPFSTSWSGDVPPELQDVMGEAADSLKTHYRRPEGGRSAFEFEYQEMLLHAQDEVIVTGKVTRVTEERIEQVGYRDRPLRRRVQLRAERLTNLVGAALRDRIARYTALRAAGFAWMALAVASGVGAYLLFIA